MWQLSLPNHFVKFVNFPSFFMEFVDVYLHDRRDCRSFMKTPFLVKMKKNLSLVTSSTHKQYFIRSSRSSAYRSIELSCDPLLQQSPESYVEERFAKRSVRMPQSWSNQATGQTGLKSSAEGHGMVEQQAGSGGSMEQLPGIALSLIHI